MAKSVETSAQNNQMKDMGTTVVELSRRQDGTWEATQTGLEIVGTGSSAARATEDMAGQIAEQHEREEIS